MTTERIGPPLRADERETLRAFLDYHRATLAMKCDGLSTEDLRRRSMPPSTLTLLGLVRHITEVERSWFFRFFGQTADPIYFTEERLNDDFDALDSAPPAEVFARWDAEVDRIRRDIAAVPLDAEFTDRRGKAYSLRWVYLHMIEEYARHNGHADLIREGIDGVTGE